MAATQPLTMALSIPAVILFLMTISLTIRSGDAIKCYECNSRYNPHCADPFTNATMDKTDCDQRNLEQFPGKKAAVCRKIIQKVKDKYRYVRSCGFLRNEKDGNDCIKRAGTFNVLVQYCTCDSDSCNDGFSVLYSSNGLGFCLLFSVLTTVFACITAK